jgi:hypothetical protein
MELVQFPYYERGLPPGSRVIFEARSIPAIRVQLPPGTGQADLTPTQRGALMRLRLILAGHPVNQRHVRSAPPG